MQERLRPQILSMPKLSRWSSCVRINLVTLEGILVQGYSYIHLLRVTHYI